MGYGRSGSTIIGNILGELPGVVHVGELVSLWRLGLIGRRVCGCGARIAQCEFWSSVLKIGFAGPPWNGIDPRRTAAMQRETVRLRTTPRILRAAARPRLRTPALEAYARIADRLYLSIREAAGADVIVDTSKHVPEAALLRLLPNADAFFVHLVRDPRAVAFSWQRVRRSPGEGRREQTQRVGSATSGRSWLVTNLGAEAIRRAVSPDRSLLVRYEDFVSEPRRTMEGVARLIGASPGDLPFVDDRTVRLGANHTAGGNPGRLSSGQMSIRSDDEWRTAQAKRARSVSTAFALPLLHRYHYPFLSTSQR